MSDTYILMQCSSRQKLCNAISANKKKEMSDYFRYTYSIGESILLYIKASSTLSGS